MFFFFLLVFGCIFLLLHFISSIQMEEKLLHPDKVLDNLETDGVVDRLILASLQSFYSVFPDLIICLVFPPTPAPNVWGRLQVQTEGR